jgi:hypothetical protein
MSRGGISKQCNIPQYSDRVIVIAGSRLGVDAKTGLEYWVGRNSYRRGRWFRLALGKNYLNAESNMCTFAVPAMDNVR